MRATSSGLKMTGALRGPRATGRCLTMSGRSSVMSNRNRSAEPVRQMQQVASDIFPGRSIGRAPKKNGKALDPPNVIGLCLDHEIADRHVFDHAPAQRADALIGHGILLSEPRLLTPRSSDRSIRPVSVWL